MRSHSDSQLSRWQTRIFGTAWITYFAYYLCRLNMTVAKTPFTKTFGWRSADFGKVFSALTICYAVGQFVNGQLADRFGTRVVSSIGVCGSVTMNLIVYFLASTASPSQRDRRRRQTSGPARRLNGSRSHPGNLHELPHVVQAAGGGR